MADVDECREWAGEEGPLLGERARCEIEEAEEVGSGGGGGGGEDVEEVGEDGAKEGTGEGDVEIGAGDRRGRPSPPPRNRL